jgi:hypothetical protein
MYYTSWKTSGYWLLPNSVCIINRGLSQSYTNQRDKNAAKVNGYFTNNRRFGERNSDSSPTQVNQVIPNTCLFHAIILISCKHTELNHLFYVVGSHQSAFRTDFCPQ